MRTHFVPMLNITYSLNVVNVFENSQNLFIFEQNHTLSRGSKVYFYPPRPGSVEGLGNIKVKIFKVV